MKICGEEGYTYLISRRGAIGICSDEIDHGCSYRDIIVERNRTRYRRKYRWNVVHVLPRCV